MQPVCLSEDVGESNDGSCCRMPDADPSVVLLPGSFRER
ncbi:hypothetical protein ACPOL_0587 [Acidisarcina polymorpha]|uniref:Uncharacterized protein n=1 Tax=Acidisarcina polymorpha TaxID=2211140 RepID=A0A2Z5FT17_9BACT|nr:hypothetical protein ACPOL_0587 [Acidisarcina polymorpha]